jgi:hypothetical protein
MNVALPEVVAAAVDEDVDGAVTDGVLGEVGAVVEGEVDCAIALVNARPLTAATAMMFLSMFASWASCERSGRRRKPASLGRQRGNRHGVPIVRHIHAAIRDAKRVWYRQLRDDVAF